MPESLVVKIQSSLILLLPSSGSSWKMFVFDLAEHLQELVESRHWVDRTALTKTSGIVRRLLVEDKT